MIKHEHGSGRLIMEMSQVYLVDDKDKITVIKHRYVDGSGKGSVVTNQVMYDMFDKYDKVAVETEEGIYTNFEIIGDEDALSVEEALKMVCEQTSKPMSNMADSLKNIAEKL